MHGLLGVIYLGLLLSFVKYPCLHRKDLFVGWNAYETQLTSSGHLMEDLTTQHCVDFDNQPL